MPEPGSNHAGWLRLLVVLLLGLVALVAGSAATGRAQGACSLVASRSGSDASRGSGARPFRTVQRLAGALRSGQTGCLRQGTYTEANGGYVLRVGHGGNAGAPITIRSYPGERATLAGVVYVPAGSNHVVMSGLSFDASRPYNATASNGIDIKANDVTVEFSDVTNHGWQSCFILGNASIRAAGTVIRKNRVHDCGDPASGNQQHSIYLANTDGAQIVDNVFWGVSAYHIHLYPNAQGTLVEHNVLDGAIVGGGVVFGGDASSASSGNTVQYNVITNSAKYNVSASWDGPVGVNNVVRNNCLWGGGLASDNGYVASGNRFSDPGYVDRGRANYRLNANSPCLAVVGYDTAAAQSAPVRRRTTRCKRFGRGRGRVVVRRRCGAARVARRLNG